MSISGTISSALSGLNAAARAAEVVSINVANARTEGYARRTLEIAPRTVGALGQGVQVLGVVRITDPVLTGDRRLAQASAAGPQTRADFLSGIEALLGSPEDRGSITARIADLDGALIEASSRPDSNTRLTAVLDAARGIIRTLSTTGNAVQVARERADNQIASSVGKINDALVGIAALNAQFISLQSSERDMSTLMDQRQSLIDSISGLVPLREIEMGRGAVALYTIGGVMLVDGERAATLGFVPAGVVTPDMTLASGALSGLTVNGQPVSTTTEGGLSGGGLSALFALRDSIAPGVQADLDAIARDLVERFSDPAVDTTLTAGNPGIFTDGGGPLSSTTPEGLVQRLRLNPAVDPGQGGQIWRMRDGVEAAAPGPPGNSRLLVALQQALQAPRPLSSGGPDAGARSHADFVGRFVSGISAGRLTAETEASYGAARTDALKSLEMQNGVDTDKELQDLLTIEQSYAANARVLSMVEEMLQLLLGI